MAWVLNSAQTQVEFAVRQLLIATVHGHFRDFTADVHLDLQHPERSGVSATIDVGSLTTGNPVRDAHLRSGDFFDAARYPRLTFTSERAALIGADTFWLRGDLTIHGVTRAVTLSGKVEAPTGQPPDGRTIRFRLTAEVDREDFGMDWNVPLDSGGRVVGRAVQITIDALVVETPERAAGEPGLPAQAAGGTALAGLSAQPEPPAPPPPFEPPAPPAVPPAAEPR